MSTEVVKEEATETISRPEPTPSIDKAAPQSSSKAGIILGCVAIVIALIGLSAKSDQSTPMNNQDRLTAVEQLTQSIAQQGDALAQQNQALASQMTGITVELSNLGDDVKNNRDSLKHAKLQKALESIQELGQVANPTVRGQLAEVEALLNNMITAADAPATRITAEPAPQPAITSEPAPATNPASEAAPADHTDAANTPDVPALDPSPLQSF